jgi:hypothetical protein
MVQKYPLELMKQSACSILRGKPVAAPVRNKHAQHEITSTEQNIFQINMINLTNIETMNQYWSI